MEEMQKLMHGSEKRGGRENTPVSSAASILVNRNTVECFRRGYRLLSKQGSERNIIHCRKRAEIKLTLSNVERL